MPVEPDEKQKEAFDVSELIHSAARIVEQAIQIDDPASKKALQTAAKTLLQNAIDRMDESVAASIEDEED